MITIRRRQKLNNRGFSHHLVMVLVVVAVVIGGAAYLVASRAATVNTQRVNFFLLCPASGCQTGMNSTNLHNWANDVQNWYGSSKAIGGGKTFTVGDVKVINSTHAAGYFAVTDITSNSQDQTMFKNIADAVGLQTTAADLYSDSVAYGGFQAKTVVVWGGAGRIFPAASSGNYCGLTDAAGTSAHTGALSVIDASQDSCQSHQEGTMAHELGHAFGLARTSLSSNYHRSDGSIMESSYANVTGGNTLSNNFMNSNDVSWLNNGADSTWFTTSPNNAGSGTSTPTQHDYRASIPAASCSNITVKAYDADHPANHVQAEADISGFGTTIVRGPVVVPTDTDTYTWSTPAALSSFGPSTTGSVKLKVTDPSNSGSTVVATATHSISGCGSCPSGYTDDGTGCAKYVGPVMPDGTCNGYNYPNLNKTSTGCYNFVAYQ